jgi:hypothetical protein
MGAKRSPRRDGKLLIVDHQQPLTAIVQTRVSESISDLLERDAAEHLTTVSTIVRQILYRHYRVFRHIHPNKPTKAPRTP